jgi:primary-amine oxidase
MSTATIKFTDQTAPAATDHPLNPLSANEIRAVRGIVEADGLLGEDVRFVYVALDEPHKKTVQAFRAGDPIDRRARVLLLDRATGLGSDLVVSATDERIVSAVAVDGVANGHVPILDQEFDDIESFLLECQDWLDAMRKRDLDPAKVRAVPLSAGVFGHEDEVGRRIVRVLAFYQYDAADLPWRTRSTAWWPTSTSPDARW